MPSVPVSHPATPARRHLPRRLFDAVYEMNAALNEADFITAVIVGLSRLIRADVCVVQFFDRGNGLLRFKSIPEQAFIQSEVDYYTAHPEEMPLVPYYERSGDTKARRISDVVDEKKWLASEYYRRCLQRLNLPHTLALPIQIDATTIAAVSFNRSGRDFSRADCEVLDAFAPHFRLAWSRHQAPWRLGRKTKRSSHPGGLTIRESDILYWITQGKQNREIAQILGISFYTVQKHVANILRKLDVENRHALTVHALNPATAGGN